MQIARKKQIIFSICLVSIILLPGCTNWKKKYMLLESENKNLKGLLDVAETQKGQLAERVSQDQATIEELQRQIDELNKTPEDATGFGPGYDVAVDADAGTITVTLPNAILFDSGKAELKKATITELDHILSVIKQNYAGRLLDVVGHTDTDPIKKSKWKDNWELSAQRALTVTRYLVERGIPDKEIRAVGSGESKPVVPNTSAANKAKNRRVEIVVHMR
ncbi:MAG: OmpA family protein [Sedimentisphaerales bacterium]|nr:OmpA family protein [Sedimentisphaerales bacterium]